MAVNKPEKIIEYMVIVNAISWYNVMSQDIDANGYVLLDYMFEHTFDDAQLVADMKSALNPTYPSVINVEAIWKKGLAKKIGEVRPTRKYKMRIANPWDNSPLTKKEGE